MSQDVFAFVFIKTHLASLFFFFFKFVETNVRTLCFSATGNLIKAANFWIINLFSSFTLYLPHLWVYNGAGSWYGFCTSLTSRSKASKKLCGRRRNDSSSWARRSVFLVLWGFSSPWIQDTPAGRSCPKISRPYSGMWWSKHVFFVEWCNFF